VFFLSGIGIGAICGIALAFWVAHLQIPSLDACSSLLTGEEWKSIGRTYKDTSDDADVLMDILEGGKR
jgi:hypothetical protein